MNEKQLQILEAAMKCFAQKGYHATTMQVIADSLGIAKGSLYFYFKSKEDMLLSAFTYYNNEMKQLVLAVARDHRRSPREVLRKQLVVQMEQFLKYQDFIIMLFGEQVFYINDEIKRLIASMKAEVMCWLYNRIIAIYGGEVKLYALDAAVILDALVREFVGLLILRYQEFDKEQLSHFLMNRLDDLVQGLLKRGESPIYTLESLGDFLKLGAVVAGDAVTVAEREFAVLGEQISALEVAAEVKAELQECYQALLAEWSQPVRSKVIIKGLISYLRTFELPTLCACLAVLEREI